MYDNLEQKYETKQKSEMKIVLIDSYNRESVADRLIAENVNEAFGELIVKLLNKQASSEDYFVLKPDDYRLSRGMEDLV